MVRSVREWARIRIADHRLCSNHFVMLAGPEDGTAIMGAYSSIHYAELTSTLGVNLLSSYIPCHLIGTLSIPSSTV